MKIWITTVGQSPFAVINPIWASCKEENFIPERIYLFYNENTEKNLEIVMKWVEKILNEYNCKADFLKFKGDEIDFKNFIKKINEIVSKEKNNEIAIDMTPGRKFMSALSMVYGIKNKINRVYYLHLSDNSYTNKEYILIPKLKQKLYEMRNSLEEI